MTASPRTKARNRAAVAPVRWWAGAGAAILAVQAIILGRWVAGGGWRMAFDPDAATSGQQTVALWTLQAAVLATLGIAAYVVIRGCRTAGEVTYDAALLTGLFCSIWSSATWNYFSRQVCHYHHSLVHVPSWGPYIPGWHGADNPADNIETVIFPGGLTFPLLLVFTWLVWWTTQRISHWRPQWGRIRLTAVAGLTAMLVLGTVEQLSILLGTYMYINTIDVLSLWPDHWYHLPLTEVFSFAFLWLTPFVMARRRDPFFFRGSGDLGKQHSSAFRLLAGIGFANAASTAHMLFLWCTLLISGPAPAGAPGSIVTG
ncbi:spirocyclase AveC family protein [Streptomyces olivoreticuli]|uniref:spirocyclase AveC family protein n=1 Tax=Streptomyces olivoreticuli TaxID=68246 RepID=UPI00265AE6FA|nr:spirocyclase AveC family protein [Streptomyces olivoreticuli]WKK21921.1 spirocyclase AveC family protein [Streptomyces olivoreticuli]WKK26922.1 spirocyclase AveC family protein [Streptomyces olivoreticuli]